VPSLEKTTFYPSLYHPKHKCVSKYSYVTWKIVHCYCQEHVQSKWWHANDLDCFGLHNNSNQFFDWQLVECTFNRSVWLDYLFSNFFFNDFFLKEIKYAVLLGVNNPSLLFSSKNWVTSHTLSHSFNSPSGCNIWLLYWP